MRSHMIRVRFYGRLNRFLPRARRYTAFRHTVKGEASLKDTLEALGVPHTEIAAMLVGGRRADFSHRVRDGERVRVYPLGPGRGEPVPLRPARFLCDAHLGKLARNLRLMGLDTAFPAQASDAGLVEAAVREKRVLLTRDVGLLKNKRLTRAFFVYSADPPRQWREVIRKFAWGRAVKPFSRCLVCNGKIARVAKAKVLPELPPRVAGFYNAFYRCRDCGKVYWRGSHYERLAKLIF